MLFYFMFQTTSYFLFFYISSQRKYCTHVHKLRTGKREVEKISSIINRILGYLSINNFLCHLFSSKNKRKTCLLLPVATTLSIAAPLKTEGGTQQQNVAYNSCIVQFVICSCNGTSINFHRHNNSKKSLILF